jgi:hypothetical protein
MQGSRIKIAMRSSRGKLRFVQQRAGKEALVWTSWRSHGWSAGDRFRSSSILSRLITVQEFAAAVRTHWGIENDLHWQLDVSFQEDECRVCSDHAPANLSVIRRFALGLLKRETSCREGIKIKRMKCAGNDDYRKKVLFRC